MNDPHLTLLFLRKDNQTLLAMKKRGHGTGKWNGVGGKIELDETIQQAAIRECEEEIGVRPLKLTPAAELVFLEQEAGQPVERLAYVYFCHDWQGEPIESDEMMPEWFDEADIPYEAMWPADHHWLPKALTGTKVFGTFRYNDQHELLEHTVSSVDTLPHESDMTR
ncbi:MAG TPA: 8-oxo-dGTP diphosphatase [Verrucomicrobiae bacterium]|nr:8-oxo-dGTP diphosphatase [Verrucomicrobiae bacterium]